MNMGSLHPGGDCHSGSPLFVSAALSLSVYLPLLSLLTPLFIHPTVPLRLLSCLTYSHVPSFLHPPLLPVSCHGLPEPIRSTGSFY